MFLKPADHRPRYGFIFFYASVLGLSYFININVPGLLISCSLYYPVTNQWLPRGVLYCFYVANATTRGTNMYYVNVCSPDLAATPPVCVSEFTKKVARTHAGDGCFVVDCASIAARILRRALAPGGSSSMAHSSSASTATMASHSRRW